MPHLLHRSRQQPGHALPAILGIKRQAVPASLGKLLVGLFPAIRSHYALFGPFGTLLITDRVQW